VQRARDPLIDPHQGYLRLGREPAERQALYRELFRMHIEPESLKAVRQATQMNRVFGAEYFQKQIEAALAVRIVKRKPGPQPKQKPA
jgi:putative transposase